MQIEDGVWRRRMRPAELGHLLKDFTPYAFYAVAAEFKFIGRTEQALKGFDPKFRNKASVFVERYIRVMRERRSAKEDGGYTHLQTIGRAIQDTEQIRHGLAV